MTLKSKKIRRRSFLKGAAAAAGVFQIVPRHVVGGANQTPPSERVGAALIGCGSRGGGTFGGLSKGGLQVDRLASCDVKYLDKVDNSKFYTDFRRVLERKDIDVVAIATPPHWHALISIAAMQAGKDVLCEKPMTRFIGEGRAVVEAAKRYNRVFQIGTYGAFGGEWKKRKVMKSGFIKNCEVVYVKKGGFKVKQWSGKANLKPMPPPANLDWDMYCGPSPLKPFVRERVGGTHRNYWDYEGGGLSDMGQHYFENFIYTYGKDETSPVEIEAHAPPAHPEITGMWGWVELKYADGLTVVMDSGEWGSSYSRKASKGLNTSSLTEEQKKELDAIPQPEPLLHFGQAVKQRKQSGAGVEAAHRTATLLHLANIAIRIGRKIKYDPVKEQIIGDEEANRLVNQPMRAPWHL
jgi:predicted dehydrogenase